LGDATLNVLFEPDDEDQKEFLERLVKPGIGYLPDCSIRTGNTLSLRLTLPI